MTEPNLEGASLAELEEIYRQGELGPAPTGNWQGHFLGWLDTEGARAWHVRLLSGLLFQRTPFGIDFDRRLWWFWRPQLAAGRFLVTHGRSRWRDTDTLRLDYGISDLPIRAILYDEVKPLSPHLCLGIGGINAGPGRGDHFFFSLKRLD